MEVRSRVVAASWDRWKNRSCDGLDSLASVGVEDLGRRGDRVLVYERLLFVGMIAVLKNGERRNFGVERRFAESWWWVQDSMSAEGCCLLNGLNTWRRSRYLAFAVAEAELDRNFVLREECNAVVALEADNIVVGREVDSIAVARQLDKVGRSIEVDMGVMIEAEAGNSHNLGP